jgi:hypothetical protein
MAIKSTKSLQQGLRNLIWKCVINVPMNLLLQVVNMAKEQNFEVMPDNLY